MKAFAKICLVAALAVLPLAATAPAHAAKKMEVMVQDDGVFLYNQPYYNRDFAYLQLRALGATHLRMNVIWWMTMPEEQAMAKKKPSTVNYNWALWDAAIQRAKDYGIKVQIALTGDPPRWACARKLVPNTCDGLKPNRRSFKQFAQAAAKHFKNRVARYAIWNEPNWFTWLRPHKKSPLIYRKLYQAGYKGVKRGYRKAKVVMGETAPYFQKGRAMSPLQFIREMVCVNKRFKKTRRANKRCKGKLKLDGYAHHPYDFKVPPTRKRKRNDDVTMANLGALTKTLVKLRKKRLIRPSKRKIPVYLTEHGYYVKGSDAPDNRAISERKRRRWTVKAFDIAQRNKFVKGMLYYIFVSPPAGHPSDFFDLGLIATDGQPRGAYYALQRWVRNAAADRRVKRPRPCSPTVRC